MTVIQNTIYLSFIALLCSNSRRGMMVFLVGNNDDLDKTLCMAC